MSFFPIVPPTSSPAVPVYRDAVAGATGTTSQWTFSAVAIGPASTTRYVIAALMIEDDSGGSISSVTIGGVAATECYESAGAGNSRAGFYGALVPTGTTADIVVNPTVAIGNINRTRAATWSVTGLSSLTPTASVNDSTETSSAYDGTISVPTDGFVLGFAWHRLNSTRTFTWTNLTEDFDFTSGGTQSISGAQSTTPGSALRTATANSSPDGGLILAAWR